MTSDRQIAANRRNAQRSTGPTSPDGRVVSSQNARRHGVLSGNVTAAGEDISVYNRLLDGLMSEFSPQTQMEALLVKRLALLFWRDRRLVESERAGMAEASG